MSGKGTRCGRLPYGKNDIVTTKNLYQIEENAYADHMKLMWDEVKRRSSLLKHGLDFADLTFGFFLDALVTPASDDRLLAIGEFGGQIIVAVVFRPLGSQALSIISMRVASRKERSLL